MSFAFDSQLVTAAGPLLDAVAGSPPTPAGDWQVRRRRVTRLISRLAQELPAFDRVTRAPVAITSIDGAAIPATWYTPETPMAGPAAIFLHGGGYILGSVALFDRMIAKYVVDSGVPILAIDYRLAPEHPFPTPVEDCYAGLTWLAEHADSLGVDAERIGVFGESAGGGLAAATALLARQRGGVRPAAQGLIYPMLDDRTVAADPSLTPFAVWTAADNLTGWRAYLGDEHDDLPDWAVPARSDDLAGLAPAYIEVGELDIFRDESVRYATTLASAGVSTELHVVPGVPHCFEWLAPDTDVAIRAFANRARWLNTF